VVENKAFRIPSVPSAIGTRLNLVFWRQQSEKKPTRSVLLSKKKYVSGKQQLKRVTRRKKHPKGSRRVFAGESNES